MPDLRLIDIAGLPFACRLAAMVSVPAGAARGVVLAVHGLTRQKRDFDDMAVALVQAGYEVWCVDVPGRGGSSWLPAAQDYTLDTYARVLAALIDHQGWGAVHWVGSSMGGLIAMTLPAIGRAEVLKTLTLVDVTHRPNAQACARIAGYMPDTLPLIVDRLAYRDFVRQNLPLGDVSDAVWARFSDHQLVAVPDGYLPHYDPNIVPLAKQVLAEGIDLEQGMRALTCPIALVAGEISDLCNAAEIAGLRAIRPDMPVFMCAGAGHIPALADDASNAFIARFIGGGA